MAEFLLEMYVSRATPGVVEQNADRARSAAAALRQTGRSVELTRTIFVPEEETCFFVYEASSVEDVSDAAGLAGLTWDRLVDAVTRTTPPEPGDFAE